MSAEGAKGIFIVPVNTWADDDFSCSSLYLRSDWRWFIEDEILRGELELIVENIELLTGYEITLMPGMEDGVIDLALFSEEIVIATAVQNDGREILHYMITPAGTFDFCAFERKENGAYGELPELPLTDAIRETMFLKHCVTLCTPKTCQVQLVIDDDSLPFPPLEPEKYVAGSAAQRFAAQYWQLIDRREEIEDRNGFNDYINQNEDVCAEVDDFTGVPTRILGPKKYLCEMLDDKIKSGEIKGYKIVEMDEEERELLEEADAELEEFMQIEGVEEDETSYNNINEYVIRPPE